jgi:hypothetical protein
MAATATSIKKIHNGRRTLLLPAFIFTVGLFVDLEDFFFLAIG